MSSPLSQAPRAWKRGGNQRLCLNHLPLQSTWAKEEARRLKRQQPQTLKICTENEMQLKLSPRGRRWRLKLNYRRCCYTRDRNQCSSAALPAWRTSSLSHVGPSEASTLFFLLPHVPFRGKGLDVDLRSAGALAPDLPEGSTNNLIPMTDRQTDPGWSPALAIGKSAGCRKQRKGSGAHKQLLALLYIRD